MENKKPLVFTFSIIAIILGVTLFKQFDFEKLRFEKTGSAIIYIIVFVICIYFLIKSRKNQPEK